MQARSWLVEDIQSPPCSPARQLLGELDALRLAARQRGGLLADVDVAETHARQRLKLVADRRHRPEELSSLLHRHIEGVGDRLVLEPHLQRLAVVALALALFAGDVDVGQEVHLDLDDAVALATLAAPALDVEGEAPG